MRRIIVNEVDIERVRDLAIGRIEIVIDEDEPDGVEIYMLDSDGNRVEGGSFNLVKFMNHVLEFYNREY